MRHGNMSRRVFSQGVLGSVAGMACGAARADRGELRVGLTPVFLTSDLELLERLKAYLENRGVTQSFLDDVEQEAADFASDARKRALEVVAPDQDVIFDNVYAEASATLVEERAWFEAYEASFEEAQS